MAQRLVVYSYWTWAPGEGLGQIAPAKRTRARIEALRGLVIITSAEEVDETDLDPDGGFSRQDPESDTAAV